MFDTYKDTDRAFWGWAVWRIVKRRRHEEETSNHFSVHVLRWINTLTEQSGLQRAPLCPFLQRWIMTTSSTVAMLVIVRNSRLWAVLWWTCKPEEARKPEVGDISFRIKTQIEGFIFFCNSSFQNIVDLSLPFSVCHLEEKLQPREQMFPCLPALSQVFQKWNSPNMLMSIFWTLICY